MCSIPLRVKNFMGFSCYFTGKLNTWNRITVNFIDVSFFFPSRSVCAIDHFIGGSFSSFCVCSFSADQSEKNKKGKRSDARCDDCMLQGNEVELSTRPINTNEYGIFMWTTEHTVLIIVQPFHLCACTVPFLRVRNSKRRFACVCVRCFFYCCCSLLCTNRLFIEQSENVCLNSLAPARLEIFLRDLMLFDCLLQSRTSNWWMWTVWRVRTEKKFNF